MFTERYALMPYVKQVCLIFKGLNGLNFQIYLLPTDFLPEAIVFLTVLTAHIFKLISRFCGYYFISKRQNTQPHQGSNIGLGQTKYVLT